MRMWVSVSAPAWTLFFSIDKEEEKNTRTCERSESFLSLQCLYVRVKILYVVRLTSTYEAFKINNSAHRATASIVQVRGGVWVMKHTRIFCISAWVVKHVLIRFRWLIAIVSKYYNMPFIFAFTGISKEFRSLTQSFAHLHKQSLSHPFWLLLKMVQHIEHEKWENGKKRTKEFAKRMSAFIYHKINIRLFFGGGERKRAAHTYGLENVGKKVRANKENDGKIDGIYTHAKNHACVDILISHSQFLGIAKRTRGTRLVNETQQ